MDYINNIKGFNESMVTKFATTFKDENDTIKGLTIKVDEKILDSVTGLPAEGDLFPRKENPDEARMEFSNDDDNF
ncbi:hypothetical protein KI387_012812, partial [Taxus chinensis]